MRGPREGEEAPAVNLAVAEAFSAEFKGFSLRVGSRVLARPGRLTAVVGLVGSGKSALLAALLGVSEGEVKGTARTSATVGWAQQRTTLIATSVRENIVLGRPESDEALEHALADACLEQDLERLPLGLDEAVGERGTTLSGGQQARVGLARAYYSSPGLLVLDDPFAAVDAEVGRALFYRLRARCERTGAGALVVLNQIGLLSQGFEDVVVLKDGEVVCHGPVAEVEQDSAFRAVAEAIPVVDVAADAETQKTELGKSRRTTRALIAVGKRKSFAAPPEEKHGFVSWRVWKAYFAAAGFWPCFGFIATYSAMYGSLAFRDFWLSVWADADIREDAPDATEQRNYYAGVFALISSFNIGTTLLIILVVSTFAERAGRSMHDGAVKRLMNAPLGYFESTPLGAITSRLGADMGMVDGNLTQTIDGFLTFILLLVTLSIAVTISLPFMAVIFGVAGLASLQFLYGAAILRTDAKRVSNSEMAPLLSYVQNGVSGAAMARALDVTQFFVARHRLQFDAWARTSDLSNSVTQLTQAWCSCLHLLVLGTTFVLIRTNEWTGEGLLAMVFSYATIWGNFATLSANLTMNLLTQGTSLERLLSYVLGDLPQEARWRGKADPVAPWPAKGEVVFENVALRYKAGAPLALSGLSLTVAGGERLAVVGRTGAGKSTILTALFRIVEVESGTIRFDGVDVTSIGIHTLRRAVSMIPQEPVVMDGSVRYNLDPFDERGDDVLQAALAKAGLDLALSTQASGAGAGLSVGQKQLVTLARALLQESRLVVMDEPTSSVDQQTDRQVQQVVRSVFAGRTLVCIAHRLETVRDYDRLAVIGEGKLVEVGAPAALLADENSAAAVLFASHRTED
jgi:ABC-type multidrug transport system fused ATPase/permease subunit